MKKLLIVLAVLAIWQFSIRPGTFASAETTDYSHPHYEVVLFATTWCGYCKKTRKYFTDNNIAYYEYDIDSSSEGRGLYKDLNGRGVPLVVVGNRVIRGYNPAAMQKALATLK